MDLAEFREYCLSKPSTTEDTPFGPDVLVFKVRGKMFALAALDEVPTRVNLKCDPGFGARPSRSIRTSQARLSHEQETLDTVEIQGGIPDLELRKMIDHSHDLVIKGLPKPTAKVGARSRRSSTAARRARH
jgi:predicted DNA-binding protein (MmcQ/YjbR family)